MSSSEDEAPRKLTRKPKAAAAAAAASFSAGRSVVKSEKRERDDAMARCVAYYFTACC